MTKILTLTEAQNTLPTLVEALQKVEEVAKNIEEGRFYSVFKDKQ